MPQEEWAGSGEFMSPLPHKTEYTTCQEPVRQHRNEYQLSSGLRLGSYLKLNLERNPESSHLLLWKGRRGPKRKIRAESLEELV